jgi:tRNA(Ile)-lysidine synthetase-like protein
MDGLVSGSSRHIQRHYDNAEGGVSTIPSKAKLDDLALKTAKLFVETHKDEIECGMIPLPMYIFSLMPYRHDRTIESVEYVQKCVEQCAGMNEQMDAMLGRFRKATNRRMALLQDEARQTGSNAKKKVDDSSNNADSTTIYKDEDILETFPFEADLTPTVNHPLHKTIVAFLANCGIHPSREEKRPLSVCRSPLIVSLSGGVDSMVIAAVLSHLKNSCGFHLDIIAVHIDYANRPESGAEADFVRRYCDTLDITFRCLQINEVTRGVTARDNYERIAREMRYGSYREAIAVLKEGMDSKTSKEIVVGVMLGHHRGDLRENVLSNAHKGGGPLDLSGMTEVSTNDGVTIYRPLLPLEKSFVLDYAHKFGVPYFKGTCVLYRES